MDIKSTECHDYTDALRRLSRQLCSSKAALGRCFRHCFGRSVWGTLAGKQGSSSPHSYISKPHLQEEIIKKIWFEGERIPGFDDLFAGVAEATGSNLPDEPLQGIAEADAVIAGGLIYDAAVMDLAPNLKVVARKGIGVDTVDVAAATDRGIAVVNTPDAPSVPTAEQTMMLLLAVAKHLKQSELRLRAGEDNFHARHNAVELSGKTLGLAGFGRIARLVAKMAQGL